MSKLAGVCALVVTATLASAASAAAPPGAFNFAFPLPALGYGSIHEVVLKFKLPAGTTVSGTPFVFHLANGSTVPGYIRAAYAVVAKGSGTWDIFVGINAPTTTKGRRLSSSSGGATLDTTLQADPEPGASVSATETPGDACERWLAVAKRSLTAAFFVLAAASESEGAEIMKYIRSHDVFCK